MSNSLAIRDDLRLPELLRRCHREELLALATIVKVNPRGLGFATLCRNIDLRLRQVGGNELSNIVFRRGEGPDYAEVLAGLCKRLDIACDDSVESTELRLLDNWLARSWDELTGEQRTQLWAQLGLEGEMPVDGKEASEVAQEELGRGFGYRVGLIAAGGAARLAGLALTPLLGPFAGIATMMWLTRPKDEVLLPAVLEVCRLRQAVRHRVTVGVVGSPSSGKDAAIKAIFGVDSGNIDPVAGSTREVSITRLPGPTALFVVNTPGMGDVVESVTEEARQVLDHIDVYIYVLNAQGGVQQRELADFEALRATGRPVLVALNKIDTLKAEDRERYLDDARHKLGVAETELAPVAFHPLPQLSEAPIGVGFVRQWLVHRLMELGKDPGELQGVSEGSLSQP